MAKERPEVHSDSDSDAAMAIDEVVQKSPFYGSNVFMRGCSGRGMINKVVVCNPPRSVGGRGILLEDVSVMETDLSVVDTDESASMSMRGEVVSIGSGLSLGKEWGDKEEEDLSCSETDEGEQQDQQMKGNNKDGKQQDRWMKKNEI